MSDLKKISTIILAAGMSERFGYPKAFLEFNEHRNFLEQILEQYKLAGIEQMVVIFNNQSLKFAKNHNINILDRINIVTNKHPEYERFYSIMLGIRDIGDSEFCFIQNVDNPFVDYNLLRQMLNVKDSADFIVPVYKGRRGHPVLINKKIINHILSLQGHNYNLKEILLQFSRREVECESEKILCNINTLEEYQRLFN